MWKDIKDYEGLYQANELGQVRSLDRKVLQKNGRYHTFFGCIIKPKINNSGYQVINLNKNAKCVTRLVHRLIAQTFIPNPDNLPEINHKDCNPMNNRVDNLEWCSRQYNLNYGDHNEKVAEKNSKVVYQYSLDGEFIRSYVSTIQAAKENNIKQGGISNCCLNKVRSAGGYIWRYIK